MKKPRPVIAVVNPHMSLIDLVALAKAEEPARDWRFFIEDRGVELNGIRFDKPDKMLSLKTGDILRFSDHDWYEIKVVDVNEMETQRLKLKLMEQRDVNQIEPLLPQWDLVRYLAAVLPDPVPGARDILNAVIGQPEPKSEWLWKIEEKAAPEKIIGVAHLRTDGVQGQQNIWLAPEHHGKGLAEEALSAISEHAFEKLGFEDIEFKDAFAHAAGTPELDDLRRKFNTTDSGTELHPEGSPDKPWSLNKKKWHEARDRIRAAFAETAEDDDGTSPAMPLAAEEAPAEEGAPVRDNKQTISAATDFPAMLPPLPPAPILLPDGSLLMPDGVVFNPQGLLPMITPNLPLVLPVLPAAAQLANAVMPQTVPALPAGPGAVQGMLAALPVWRPGMPWRPGMALPPGSILPASLIPGLVLPAGQWAGLSGLSLPQIGQPPQHSPQVQQPPHRPVAPFPHTPPTPTKK